MGNLFRFFRCISSLQLTAEADVLGSCSEFKLLLIFCERVCGRKYFRLFSRYFAINFSRMCLRDQIFRVLLGHFISEVVGK